MIIIGVGMASDRLFPTQNTTTQQTNTADIRGLERAQRSAAGALRLARIANGSLDGHEMKAIAVHITHHRETDRSRYSYGEGSSGGGYNYGREAHMETDMDTKGTRCSLESGDAVGVRESVVVLEDSDV